MGKERGNRMYYPTYIISPFSQAKKNLSDSAKRLAVTESVLLAFNGIFYSIVIYLLFTVINEYSYFLLLDLIFVSFMLMIWLITLWGAQMVVIVVNYIFFIKLSSAFTALGNSETRIADSAKKSGNYMLAGIIINIIASLVSIFNLFTNFIIIIVSSALLTYAFYHEVETFKDLKKINLYQGYKNSGLFYSQALRCVAYILLPIALYQPIRTAAIILIIFLILLSISSIFFVLGLFKLSTEAELIIDPTPQPVHPSQVQGYQQPVHPSQQPQPQQLYVQLEGQKPQPLQKQSTQQLSTREEGTMFCSNCGSKVKKTAKFCENCGFNLTS